MKNNLINRITGGILISTLLLILSFTPVPAVDEDYFIPYTDNYGYEYDPETGTYIKSDQSNTNAGGQKAPETDESSTVASQQTTNPVQAGPAEDDTAVSTPVFVAGAIVILGVAMVFARNLRREK